MARTYDRPLFRSRDTALVAAVALWLAGTVVLWDAYERRGLRRPGVLRVAANLPSMVG